jgi:hypothetical protein
MKKLTNLIFFRLKSTWRTFLPTEEFGFLIRWFLHADFFGGWSIFSWCDSIMNNGRCQLYDHFRVKNSKFCKFLPPQIVIKFQNVYFWSFFNFCGLAEKPYRRHAKRKLTLSFFGPSKFLGPLTFLPPLICNKIIVSFFILSVGRSDENWQSTGITLLASLTRN